MVSELRGGSDDAAVVFERAMDAGEYVAAVRALGEMVQAGWSAVVLRVPLSESAVASVVDAASTADALYELGAAFWAVDGYELLAMDVWAEASARGSRDAVAAIGEALEWWGLADRAIVWLESAIEDRPARAPWLEGLLGEALRARDGDTDRVLGLLADAAASHAEFGVSYAKALRARGRVAQARSVLSALVEARVYGAALQLGNLLWDEDDDVQGAEEAYRQGMVTRDAHSAFNLGVLLRHVGRGDEAAHAFAEARRLGDLTTPPSESE